MAEALTGGCQCGAVRFRTADVGDSGICHCRMCQKAFGSFFAPLVTSRDLVWTRGTPAYWRSSNRAQRGFCANCGTPLFYKVDDSTDYEVAVGAFDDPLRVSPDHQVNLTNKLVFFDTLHTLPVAPAAEHDAFNATIVSRQHPDHDTETWPLAGWPQDM